MPRSHRDAVLALEVVGPLLDAAAHDAPRAVADLLGDLTALEAGATGALALGTMERVHGTVLLESGRVCWATTAGMGERLRALVAERATGGHARARVDEVFRVCLRDKAPIGAALVAAGLVTTAGLRAVFERQTAEALSIMAGGGARPLGWIPRHAHPYDAPFTFSTAALLAAATAIHAPHAALAAAEELAAVLAGAAAGLSYTSSPDRAAPMLVATTGTVELELGEILALGRWATDALARALFLARGAPFVSAALDRSTALIAWSRRFVHVALCTEPSSMAWVLIRLERDHRARISRDEGDDQDPRPSERETMDTEVPRSGAILKRRAKESGHE